MTDERALRIPPRLIRRYGTRNPFSIAEAQNIEVLIRNDFKRQKGAFKVIARNSFLFINGNLSDEMQKMVCAHELGHAHLHRTLGMRPEGLLEFELFNITDQCEYDANAFAAALLLDDREILEYAHDGYDIVQIARITRTNVNMILLKMIEMNNQGYHFKLPYTPSRRFLGYIEDGSGDI